VSTPSHFEVVHTGPRQFHARFVAGNGETVWVTESYTRRQAAREACWLLAEHFLAHIQNEIPDPFMEVDERSQPS
jgi:uncharacterized protein YegP (UPF0339 family)